jgi:hypothetical protein
MALHDKICADFGADSMLRVPTSGLHPIGIRAPGHASANGQNGSVSAQMTAATVCQRVLAQSASRSVSGTAATVGGDSGAATEAAAACVRGFPGGVATGFSAAVAGQ